MSDAPPQQPTPQPWSPAQPWPPQAPWPSAPPASRLGAKTVVFIVVLAVLAAAAVGALAATLLQRNTSTAPPAPLPVAASPSASASPSMSPSPSASPTTDADTVTLSGGTVVPLLPGWEVYEKSDDGATVIVYDGHGRDVMVMEESYDTPQTALGLAAGALETWLRGDDAFTHVKTLKPQPVDTFGSISDLAAGGYQAVHTGDQGATRTVGIIYVALKDDGSALFIWLACSPPRDFEEHEPEFAEIVSGTAQSFAGGASPDTDTVRLGP
jgi:hypothetical protein